MSNPSSCLDTSMLKRDRCQEESSCPRSQRPGCVPAPNNQTVNEGLSYQQQQELHYSSSCGKGATFPAPLILKDYINLKKHSFEGHYILGQNALHISIAFWKASGIFGSIASTIIHVQNDDPESSQLMSNPRAARLHVAFPAGHTAQHPRSGGKTPMLLPCFSNMPRH